MGELVRLTFPDRPQWLTGRCRGIGGHWAKSMENGADAVEGENRGASRA